MLTGESRVVLAETFLALSLGMPDWHHLDSRWLSAAPLASYCVLGLVWWAAQPPRLVLGLWAGSPSPLLGSPGPHRVVLVQVHTVRCGLTREALLKELGFWQRQKPPCFLPLSPLEFGHQTVPS